MNQQILPTAGVRTAFERAAATHDAARGPQGAARQIASPQAPASVEQAIADAARRTTVDFDFLVAQAQVESSMDPDARARTSSATGLYQFIESTWLGTMQRHGERFGLGDVAAQIGVSRSGSAYVADPEARSAILAMRSDPQIAALMAAGLAEDNRAHLAPILGRQPDHGELYLAHFLGAGGAGRFLAEMAENPDQSAAALFRRPAAANRAIFYEPSGRPRSLAGVMEHLSGKLERARDAAIFPAPSEPRAPYMIADEAVFGPRVPPQITGRPTPRIAAAPVLGTGEAPARRSMSGLLEDTFGAGQQPRGALSSSQVQRAYDQLKALGL